MAIKSYVLTQDYSAPYVMITGLPHNPQQIKVKKFKKGDIVQGEMKHANNNPAFVLVGGNLVFPLEVLKELVTKAIIEDYDVPLHESTLTDVSEPKKTQLLKSSNPKVNYIDSMIIGTIVGLGAVYLANKQGWIAEPDNKHYLYGGIIGAVGAAYLVYRHRENVVSKKFNVKPKE
jgi:hypothetical protein